MTRREIKAAASANVLRSLTAAGLSDVIGRIIGPDGNIGDPVTLNDELDQQVLELCQACRGVSATYTTDIEDGTGDICPPPLLYYERAILTTETGDKKPIAIIRSDQSPGEYHVDPQEGEPTTVTIFGGNAAALYPTPDYDATDGLTWKGIGYIDNSLWDAETDECPLLERFHRTVVYGLTARLFESIAQFALSDSYAKRYRYGKGHFEGEMHTLHEAIRHKEDYIPVVVSTVGANPFNWP
jgi:hypothetical protein